MFDTSTKTGVLAWADYQIENNLATEQALQVIEDADRFIKRPRLKHFQGLFFNLDRPIGPFWQEVIIEENQFRKSDFVSYWESQPIQYLTVYNIRQYKPITCRLIENIIHLSLTFVNQSWTNAMMMVYPTKFKGDKLTLRGLEPTPNQVKALQEICKFQVEVL